MKKVLLALLLLFSFTSLFAKSNRKPAHDNPGKNEVIIVGKIKLSSSFDKNLEGYRHLFFPKSQSADDFNNIYFVIDDGMESSNFGLWGMRGGYKNWDLNQTFYFDNKPGKSRKVNIKNIRVSLFADKDSCYYFDLPLNISVTCPSDEKFIYVGTFEYDVDYALNATEIRHIDEFEATKKEIESLYGKPINLVKGDFSLLK